MSRARRRARSASARATMLLLAAALGAADAASWRDLDGSYAITAPDMLAPGPDAPPDSHFRLQLRGLTARDLYNAMQVAPVTDECTGGRLKAAEDLRCVFFEDSGRYQCDFSIDLRDGSLDLGLPC